MISIVRVLHLACSRLTSRFDHMDSDSSSLPQLSIQLQDSASSILARGIWLRHSQRSIHRCLLLEGAWRASRNRRVVHPTLHVTGMDG
jgi:hypothetical protein